MGKIWGGVLAATGFIACPCHLPITIPLTVSLLGGGAAAGFIADHKGLIYGLATAYFIGGLGIGWLLLTRRRDTQDCCEVPAAESRSRRMIQWLRMSRRPVKTTESAAR